MRQDPLGLIESCRAFGDVVPMRFGPFQVAMLTNPALVEQVLTGNQKDYPKSEVYKVLERLVGHGLVTSGGELWRRQRRLIQPSFDHREVERYAEVMVHLAEQAFVSWGDGEVRNIHADMAQLTLAIVAKVLLDSDLSAEAGSVGQLLATSLRLITEITEGWALFLPNWVPTPTGLRLQRTVRQLDRLVFQVIEGRRKSGERRRDLLAALLEAHDERGGMSDGQLRDEIMTFILAGHETTALALTWAWRLMGERPEVQDRLAEEAERATHGERLSAAHYQHLTYARAVMSESMRLYPPAPIIERETTQDTELGGVELPRKTFVMMSQWVMHRHPDYWDRPDEFVPERWLDPGFRPSRGAYFPFGGGARMCIGASFAELEGALILAAMAQRLRMTAIQGEEVHPRLNITLRPSGPVNMLVERR